MRKIIAVFLLLCGCSEKDDIYTLYKKYPGNSNFSRVHVATFDADGSKDSTGVMGSYNMANCEIAEELFEKLGVVSIVSGEKVNYWCEKGRYRE